MQKSIQLDPLNAPALFAYASILSMSGWYQEALIQYDKLSEISPYFPDATCHRGIIHLALGEKEIAKELFNVALKVAGSHVFAHACLGMWYADMKQPEKVQECLKKLLEYDKSMPAQPVLASTALIYAVVDKPDEMFQYFSRSVEAKEHFALFLKGFEPINKYASDSRYVDLLKKMGLEN